MTGTNEQAPKTDQGIYAFLTYNLARAQVALNQQAARTLQKSSDLTLTQWRILALIGTAGEAQSTELSRKHAIDKGLLSRNIKALSQDGLVKVVRSKGDRRVQKLRLTPGGQSLFETLLPIMEERQNRLRNVLEPEELKMFEIALAKLEAHAKSDVL